LHLLSVKNKGIKSPLSLKIKCFVDLHTASSRTLSNRVLLNCRLQTAEPGEPPEHEEAVKPVEPAEPFFSSKQTEEKVSF